MYKRGSHVGMILSFTIFITFIIFLYSITQPALETSADKKSILENVEYLFIQNVSSNFTTASVKVTSQSGDKNCIELMDFLLVTDAFSEPYFVVKDEDSVQLSPYYSDEVFSLKVNRLLTTNLFLKIYHSKEFNLALAPPESLQCTQKERESPATYEVGSITVDKYIFEKKIAAFNETYTDYYEQLKTDLNIPPGTEFWFTFKRSDGTNITPVLNVLQSTSVYAEENPIQYIDEGANIQSGFINIKVW